MKKDAKILAAEKRIEKGLGNIGLTVGSFIKPTYFSKRFPKTYKDSIKFRMIKEVYIKNYDTHKFLIAFVSDHDKKPYYVYANDNRVATPLRSFVNTNHNYPTYATKYDTFVRTEPIVMDFSVYMRKRNLDWNTSTKNDPELTVINISTDFTPMTQKAAGVGMWLRSNGHFESIAKMNDYHLMNALKLSVRTKANRSKYFELKEEIIKRGLTPR